MILDRLLSRLQTTADEIYWVTPDDPDAEPHVREVLLSRGFQVETMFDPIEQRQIVSLGWRLTR